MKRQSKVVLCGSGHCPTIYLARGKHIIVQGYVLSVEERESVKAGRVPSNELLVKIPVELVQELFRRLSQGESLGEIQVDNYGFWEEQFPEFVNLSIDESIRTIIRGTKWVYIDDFLLKVLSAVQSKVVAVFWTMFTLPAFIWYFRVVKQKST